MRSIRTKTVLLNLISIAAAITITTVISAISVANQGHESSEKQLALLCESGKNNLNSYFRSVEQSTNTVSTLIDSNLDAIAEADFYDHFTNHVEQAELIFNEAAINTNGVITYYYRIDPSISSVTNELGFWYVDLNGTGFVEHAVSDLTDDSLECKWFFDTKAAGHAIWLPPYITDNLDIYVVSYNVPVYRTQTNGEKTFIGVVGIEISYHTLGEQIKDIRILRNGFAYIVENERGSIIYHPYIDILGMPEEDRPSVPAGFLSQLKSAKHHITYTFQGVEKHAYWLDLANDMSIVVAVPISEVNETWIRVVLLIVLVAALILAAAATATIIYAKKITKPLQELTLAAEKINKGDYDIELTYKGDDEIGVLTTTTNKLINHLGGYINDLNSIAYSDALTSVQNKSAFDVALNEIQTQILSKQPLEFAIVIMDCDNLKDINDAYGHDKGNVYLKNSSLLMTRVFRNSTIYRIGGDEFAVILVGEDYQNRETLREEFIVKSKEICAFVKEPWEQVKVSIGIASYDPAIDNSAEDVMIHADHLMYEHKREKKKANK